MSRKPKNKTDDIQDRNSNIDSVMGEIGKKYRQILAIDYLDIAKKSNLLSIDGYTVKQIIPVKTDSFLILGEK
jgi:hypothetical protein